MYGYIYKTVNLINNKYYIGKHKSESFDKTYYGSGKILKQALSKYGRENFKIEVLEYCETLDQLNEREKYYIDLLQSDNCYNIAKGGNGGDTWSGLSDEMKGRKRQKLSYKMTHLPPEVDKEWRRKLSESSKGRLQSEETRRKKSKTLMGHEVSQETRDKISKTKKEFYQTNEGKQLKQHLSEINKDKSLSEETKKKISESLKGTIFTQERKDNISAAKGTHVKNVEDNKTFTSMTKACKEYHISPKTLSACIKGERETAGGFHWIRV